MESGTYRIYRHIHTLNLPEYRLIGRFWIDGKNFHILEDHEFFLESALPDGELDQRHQAILNNLMTSGYFRIVHDEQTNQGLHDDLVQDLDLGPEEPDAEYLLSKPSCEPSRVEIFRRQCYYRWRKTRRHAN
jgi:hypothetical protein